MSTVGRVTLWTGGAMLVVLVVAILVMLDALRGQIDPAWLHRVRPEPAGTFVRSVREEPPHTLVVEYDDGLMLRVPVGPRRIVSTLPGITEMIASMGALDRLAAVSPWCDTPPAVRHLPRVTVQPMDAEGILAVRPDLVVADRRLHRRDLAIIQRRCRHVLLLETSRSLPHLMASSRLLARVLGTPEAARADARFRARAEALVRRVEAERPAVPPRVLVVAQWDPLYVLGPGSLLDDLLRVCGCVNVAADLGSDASGTFHEELVLARAPDWILAPKEPLPARLAERWRHVPAVRAGHVAPAWSDDLVRGGPRILDGLERLAAVLHGHRPPAWLEAPR